MGMIGSSVVRARVSHLYTAIVGVRRPFIDRELVRSLARHPLGAARAVALIHWQALRLYLKGARYRKRPPPPKRPVT